VTRPAPEPTEPNRNGNQRLAASFSEWMMGWPSQWVTDPAIGISRNDQLKIVGNGVCPQQAAAALRYLLEVTA
jgi:DNA (cytosine-5)-methyltransferase 1